MPNLTNADVPRREQRLSLRVTERERQLVEQAALLISAGDVTRFVVRASVDAAINTIALHETSRVSSEMRQALYDLLLNPPPPSAALKRLAARPTPSDVEIIEE